MTKANIAVIMVSHNDLSEECLRSIQEARKRTSLKVQLVVADNKSHKYRANEFVDRFFDDAIVLLRNEDHGYGRSCNRAAKEVDAEYYFILNPDTVLTDVDIFDKMYRLMKSNPDIGLVAPKIFYLDGRLQETCKRFPKWYMPFITRTRLGEKGFGKKYLAEFAMRDYDHLVKRNVDWVQGSAMFVDGVVWNQLFGFDDRYWLYFEDIDLCRRIHLAGKRVVYDPETTMKHAHGKESAAYANIVINLMKKKEARGHLISWFKYMLKWVGTSVPIVDARAERVAYAATATEEFPKVAITYLTYNGKDSYRDITRCLKSLQEMDYPLDKVEVNCVENPSPHGASWPFIEQEWMSLSGTKFPKLSITKNQNDLGFSGAHEVGWKLAEEHGCKYVFLLNQDADVAPGFLKEAVRRAEADERVGFVQSLVLLGQEKNLLNSWGNQYHYMGYGWCGGYRATVEQAAEHFVLERAKNPDLIVEYFCGAAVLARISMLESIGLFDPKFYMYHEDTDAAFNARIHGWKTVVEPKSVVYHYYEFNKKSVKKFYWIERNRYVLPLTYYKWPTLLLLALPFFGVECISLVFALKSGWWQEKLRAWAFYWKPSTWKWILARRAKMQRERRMSDRELLAFAESEIKFQEGDTGGFIVTNIANPLLKIVWRFVYVLMRW